MNREKTADVFDRYDIVSERDLSDGVARLATFRADAWAGCGTALTWWNTAWSSSAMS
jgi:hypothetical protein